MKVEAIRADGKPVSIEMGVLPYFCPFCHRTIEPIVRYARLRYNNNGTWLDIALGCPAPTCELMFLCTYVSRKPDGWELKAIEPIKPRKPTVRESVAKISPDFVEIFTQAHHAEHYKLNHVCGPGFRKALEFLIKDYAAHRSPNDREKIAKMHLGDCISQYVDDERVQGCATKAAWIGNDETHYYRKWEDKDLDDLKTLIRLTVNWIDNVLMTESFDHMDDGPPSAEATDRASQGKAPAGSSA